MMTREFATAVRLVIATVVICCLVYPVAILAFAIVAVPQKRLGSLIEAGTAAGGLAIVAQAFRARSIFGRVLRPSATMRPQRAAATCLRTTRWCASVPRRS